MHIAAINASHRGDQGCTRFLIDRLFEGAAGATCEVITLAKLKIQRCLSCLKCQNEEHHLHCVYENKDDAASVFNAMAQADVFVFATPIYMLTMTGLMKNLLDRLYSTMDVRDMRLSESGLLHHHINPAISSKPFVALICCSNIEDETPRNAIAYFRTYACFMKAQQVGLLVRNAVPLFEHARSRPAEGYRQFPAIPEVIQADEQAGRELVTQGRILRRTQRQANQEIIPIPFFHLLKRLEPIKRKIIERADDVLA